MTLTRWNPISEMNNLQREINRVLNGFSPRTRDEDYESAVWSPMVDIVEDADQYLLMFDLPGVSKDDVKMHFTENTLKISGERKSLEERKDATFHRLEKMYGRFYRSFSFPAAVNADKISASYRDGVLTVTVPKAEEMKPKQIAIN